MLFYLPPLRRQAAALLQGAAQLFGVRWLGSALVGGDFVAATWLRRSQIVYGPLSKMKGIQMKTLLCSYVLTLLLTPVFAQQKTPPPPGPARPLNLPRITEKKLSNGLTVVLAPLANVPKVTAILTFRAAGTAANMERHPGIAQISAAVATEGTDTRTSKQIKEELRSIGGSLS